MNVAANSVAVKVGATSFTRTLWRVSSEVWTSDFGTAPEFVMRSSTPLARLTELGFGISRADMVRNAGQREASRSPEL